MIRNLSTNQTNGSANGHLPDFFRAMWQAQPRAIRVFNKHLEVIWDNTEDRSSSYPVYRDRHGLPVAIPADERERRIWPVFQVMNGCSDASRVYYGKPAGALEEISFRVRSWPMINPFNREQLYIEEIESMTGWEGHTGGVRELDLEVEHLLESVVEYLEDGSNGNIMQLRLPNPNLETCKKVRECGMNHCPAYNGRGAARCWEVTDTRCPELPQPNDLIAKFHYCTECEVFELACPDPLSRVSENFNRLISLLQMKYVEAIEAQRQLQQADKMSMMGELLGGIAHEIKNPLGIIIGRLDLLNLEMESLTPTEVDSDLDVIREQTTRVKNIIDHLLKMARPDRREHKEISVNEIINETLPMIRKTLKNNNVTVTTELANDLLPIKADQIQIQQVLLNLILNARDAMPGGGAVKISTRSLPSKNDHGIELTVKDNGEGMTEEQTGKMFLPFFSTKIHKGGTGLGLAICQRIMRQHQGRIEAKSKLNEGTIMSLWFPTLEGDR